MNHIQYKEEKVIQLFTQAEEVIKKTYADAEGMREYLDFQMKVGNYSIQNTAMIMAQHPQAKKVGSYQYWKEQGTYVRRGEHGIAILVPEEGNGGHAYFRIGYVFDICQTSVDEKKLEELLQEQEQTNQQKENMRQDDLKTLIEMAAELENQEEGWPSETVELKKAAALYILCRRYAQDAPSIGFEGLDQPAIQEMNVKDKRLLLLSAFQLVKRAEKMKDRNMIPGNLDNESTKEVHRIQEKRRSDETPRKTLENTVQKVEKDADAWENGKSSLNREEEQQDLNRKFKEERNRIEDFGKKIGGARKDIWKERGLSIEDITDMTDGEAKKYITKNNIWRKPDYMQMIQDGVPIHVAYFIKEVRNALPAKVSYSYEDTSPEQIRKRQKDYISLIRDVKEQLFKIKEDADIFRFFHEFVDAGIYVNRNYDYLMKKTEKGYAVTNKLLRTMRIRPSDLRIMDRKIEQEQFGVAAAEKLPRGVVVRYVQQRQEYVVLKGGRILAEGLKSEKEAVEKAKELGNSGTGARKKRFMPKQLEHIRRDGPSNGITTENPADGTMYMEKFGFAGGEFGNWMSEKDRQASLNMGYDAFYDLATALEINPSEISLHQHLSIAFGARGHGKAAAHYEVEREVINLTKMSGAGSLAHEWGHAFDDIIGKRLGLKGFMTENIRDERVPESMKELIKTMKWSSSGNKHYVETDFYRNSMRADSICSKEDKGYWHSTVEMFARAFACYIHDKLSWRSDYLCGHSEAAVMIDFTKEPSEIFKAIPEGEERVQINQCFDKLFAECREMGLLKATKEEQIYMEAEQEEDVLAFPLRRKAKGR